MSRDLTGDDAGADEPVLLELARYATADAAHDHALVILATGAPSCIVRPVGDGFTLLLDPQHAERAREQITLYEEEKRGLLESTIAPERESHVTHPAGWSWHLGWVLLSGWIWLCSAGDPRISARFGQSHETVWGQGEWWRVFTALWVHADVGHWAGNALSGLVFAAICARHVGAGRAWWMILTAGSLGNACSSWLAADPAVVTVGASTAVFAALGIVCTLALRQRSDFAGMGVPRMLLRRAAPGLAGLVLLRWLGTGQDSPHGNTDVRAHLAGFAAGLMVALAARLLRRRRSEVGA